MITYLKIKNLGIIDELEIDFEENLNILTGETGAGKTLIIESLNLLSGARFSKEMIKKDKDYLLIEASLSLITDFFFKCYDDAGFMYLRERLPDDHISKKEIIVSRKVDKQGKNICKIDGELVSVNQLKDFMLNIIDIHRST